MEKSSSLPTARYWYWGALLLLLAPTALNIVLNPSGVVFESSIFSLDYRKYFADLFQGGHFFTGLHSVQLVSYSALYALFYLFGAIFGHSIGYFVVLGLFFTFGYHYLTKLLGLLSREIYSDTRANGGALPYLTSLLFFSSLSVFNFLKSNIIFLLPYFLLPALLYWAVRFAGTRQPKYLLYSFLLLILGTVFNLTHYILVTGFALTFQLLYSLIVQKTNLGSALKTGATFGLVFLPGLIFLGLTVVLNSMYGGSLSEFAGAISEDFYSFGAQFLRIFLQTTDWGLFGSWQGELYYGFSPFYEKRFYAFFGLLPYLALVALLVKAPRKKELKFSLWLLALSLVIFQFMLGFNNPIYRYLYENVFGFQIFRNITKAAPLLYLSILITLYLLAIGYRTLLVRSLVTVTVALSLIYNLPFWTASSTTFKDRTIESIPAYWQDAAAYLNSTLTSEDRTLLLPATYITEQYRWGEQKENVQGHLLDALLPSHLQTYRLGEILIGPIEMQRDMAQLFVRSELSVRQRDIDYPKLSRFAQKYGLNYVVVTSDLVSEYQRPEGIERWLGEAGYQEVKRFGEVSVYRNPELGKVSEPRNMHVERRGLFNYQLSLSPVPADRTVSLKLLTYSQNWRLETMEGEAVGEESHGIAEGYRNEWVVDLAKLEGSESLVVGTDGKRFLTLNVTFLPQRYFLLGMKAVALLFLGTLLVISYSIWRRKK